MQPAAVAHGDRDNRARDVEPTSRLLGVEPNDADQVLLRLERSRQGFAVVAVLEVAMVQAIHVDVLDPFLGEELAGGSECAVLNIESLPYLPELDWGELGQRRGTSRRGMVVA